MFLNVCAVAAGGALGAVCRYLTGVAVGKLGPAASVLGGFPLATFLANIAGCFLIGVLSVAFASEWGQARGTWKLFAITGIMGGFTTFSTFSLETVMLAQDGAWGMAVLNIVLSLAACLVGVVLGRLAAQAFVAV